MQEKAHVLPGTVESYWFENEHIGLAKTLFHRVIIPLEDFDSGLDHVEQPESSQIIFDWYELKLDDAAALDGLNLSHTVFPEAEASIYLGGAHNWCDVKDLFLESGGDGTFSVRGNLIIEFSNEGVADNEAFSFSTKVAYVSA